MKIHGKHPARTETLYGKPLARRWWVPSVPYREFVVYAGIVGGWRTVDQRVEINCPGCVKAKERRPR